MLMADSACVELIAPSPNFGARRAAVESIILHYTGMESAAAALAWLRNPASEVSCHYLINEDGTVTQLVAEAQRAWHAGQSIWRGEDDLNSRSIGIEIANAGHAGRSPPFPAAQIEATIRLCQDIIRRHGLQQENILAHSDIAPRRKCDPGEAFPWGQLHAQGVGLWVPAHPFVAGPVLAEGDLGPSVEALKKALSRYGYGLDQSAFYDQSTREAVTAFQRHFRPSRVDGRADVSTILTLQALLSAVATR